MEDGRIPKDILNGELATGSRPTGRPALRYNDVCKKDLKSCNINPADFETTSSDRSSWRKNVKTGFKQAEEKREIQSKERKSRQQQRTQPFIASTVVTATDHTCIKCGKRCSSRIGLCSPTNKYALGCRIQCL
jgi:methionyl-tRNA synthetase